MTGDGLDELITIMDALLVYGNFLGDFWSIFGPGLGEGRMGPTLCIGDSSWAPLKKSGSANYERRSYFDQFWHTTELNTCTEYRTSSVETGSYEVIKPNGGGVFLIYEKYPSVRFIYL